MLETIKHQDTGPLVVVAKLLTGFLNIDSKVVNPEKYIEANHLFDADFVAHVCAWQSNYNIVSDGAIGPDTWRAIVNAAPTCSTAKNRISGPTMAIQILVNGNIACDAVYGARTKAAVAVFQDSHGLNVDGICGPKTWSMLIVGSEAKPEPTPTPGKFVQPKDFKQASKPWGPKMYSNHNDPNQTMANSGCGPTAMADIVASTKDPEATPWTLAQLSMKWGDRTYNSGTALNFFKPHTAEYYQYPKVVKSATLDALKACLNAGGYAVCSMGPGYWTKGGHFITAWKYDASNIYCNDPASSSRKKQNITDFMKERKQFFCFYPDSEQSESVVGTPVPVVKRGEKIVDISKYQPNVDYEKLIRDTSLIILRAGYRGTGGGISEDQKFEAHANALKQWNVRFGVYFYSIAKTVAQAQEEARMFYKYAKDFNPLFWAMDAESTDITKATIVAFIDELRKLGAKKVGCYVANHLYTKYDYASIAGQMDFTWIPRYGTTPPVYKCDLWQYTSTGSVDGISGNVDLNRITGEGHDLSWFTDGEEAVVGAPVDTSRNVRVTGGTVNVRATAGTDGKVLGVARKGDKLVYRNANEESEGVIWYGVEFKGKNGWISGKYSVLE